MHELGSGCGQVAQIVVELDLSHPVSIFERMSESMVLLQRAVDSSREESRQAAIRLDAIAEFVHAAIREDGGRTDHWVHDVVSAATVDIAAALRVSRGVAEWQVRYAHDMHHKLPLLAARFRAGEITEFSFRTAAFRTGLVLDADVLARVDRTLAARMPRWGSIGRSDMHNRIDKIVAHLDADAVRRRKDDRVEPGLTVTPLTHGMSEITVITTAINAAATSTRVTALAHSVCENDPRTLAERRVDAHDAAIQGHPRLSCRCGLPDCPAGGVVVGPVVVHVLADPPSLTPPPKPEPPAPNEPDSDRDTACAPAAECRAPIGGIVAGYDGLIPPEMIAEIAPEARLTPLLHPGDTPPEPHYRPSAALAAFIRARDLTCRWPMCSVPAENCDIDHVIAYHDGGPTHPANLGCFCRTHHLVKTFWGWHVVAHPDATMDFTSPTGTTATTRPAGAAIYPTLAVPTAPISAPPPGAARTFTEKGCKMPRRSTTRAKQRAAAIAAERSANHTARTNPRLYYYDEDYTYEDTILEEQRAKPPPPPF